MKNKRNKATPKQELKERSKKAKKDKVRASASASPSVVLDVPRSLQEESLH